MSDILSQDEIDALLSTVASGEGGGEVQAAASPQALQTHVGTKPPPSVNPYDFRRPERVSKDQIRALGSIHEVFARNFGASLSAYLRTIVDFRVVSVEQLTYAEFIFSLPNPTCFVVVEAPPLEGQMCLELSPLIIYPIVDRLLGGTGSRVYIPPRAMSSIEWVLARGIVDQALEHLSEVWHNLVEARFRVVATESNPHLVHIVAPTEVVVLITFEIKLGQNAGTMTLCIPFNTVESVLSHVTSQAWFYKAKPPTERQIQRLERNLLRTPVELVAFLGRATIRLSQLKNLQVGDILTLNKRTDQDVLIRVEGTTKFAGRVGQYRNSRAIRITRLAEPDEPL